MDELNESQHKRINQLTINAINFSYSHDSSMPLDYDLLHDYEAVEQLEENKFKFRHPKSSDQNIIVTRVDQGNKMTWNMPVLMKKDM